MLGYENKQAFTDQNLDTNKPRYRLTTVDEYALYDYY